MKATVNVTVDQGTIGRKVVGRTAMKEEEKSSRARLKPSKVLVWGRFRWLGGSLACYSLTLRASFREGGGKEGGKVVCMYF